MQSSAANVLTELASKLLLRPGLMLTNKVAKLVLVPEPDLESKIGGNLRLLRPGSELTMTTARLYFGLVLKWETQAY